MYSGVSERQIGNLDTRYLIKSLHMIIVVGIVTVIRAVDNLCEYPMMCERGLIEVGCSKK